MTWMLILKLVVLAFALTLFISFIINSAVEKYHLCRGVRELNHFRGYRGL